MWIADTIVGQTFDTFSLWFARVNVTRNNQNYTQIGKIVVPSDGSTPKVLWYVKS